jgi:hypothetical protein
MAIWSVVVEESGAPPPCPATSSRGFIFLLSFMYLSIRQVHSDWAGSRTPVARAENVERPGKVMPGRFVSVACRASGR